MTVDYKMVNGTEVAVICDIENANFTAGEWERFGNMIMQRFEDMLPTVTILGVDYYTFRRIIEKGCKSSLLAQAIVGRLWEMGVQKILYLPATAQPSTQQAPLGEQKQQKPLQKSKAKDYVINGGRGYRGKPVEQLGGDGEVIREFRNAVEAGRYYGTDATTIRECCNGKCRTAGGRIWRYKEA